MKINPDKLNEKVNFWKKLLGLDHLWDIRIKIVDLASSMPEGDQDAAGTCDADSSYFQADILFCEENINTAAELEDTVVHELLHIIMDPLEIAAKSSLGPSHDSVSTMLVESTIERLSRAFIALLRRKKVPDVE